MVCLQENKIQIRLKQNVDDPAIIVLNLLENVLNGAATKSACVLHDRRDLLLKNFRICNAKGAHIGLLLDSVQSYGFTLDSVGQQEQ